MDTGEMFVGAAGPSLPTVTSGGHIDKCLFAPEDYIPPKLLPPGGGEYGEGEMHRAPAHFLAAVWRGVALSSHYPIFVHIPAEKRPHLGSKPSSKKLEKFEGHLFMVDSTEGRAR